MLKVFTIAAALIAATTAGAVAYHPSQQGFEARMQHQQRAIEDGRRSGAITWSEGNRLRAEQRAILRERDVLASDGHISHADRRILRDLQDQAEASIWALSNDSHRRLWFAPRVGR